MIKRFSEEAMWFLLNRANVFKDKATLSCFYDMISKNQAELERFELAIAEAKSYFEPKQTPKN